jgi:hypothetical protein
VDLDVEAERVVVGDHDDEGVRMMLKSDKSRFAKFHSICGLYYEIVYTRNFCCIIINYSVCHCYSLTPYPNICGHGVEPLIRLNSNS